MEKPENQVLRESPVRKDPSVGLVNMVSRDLREMTVIKERTENQVPMVYQVEMVRTGL